MNYQYVIRSLVNASHQVTVSTNFRLAHVEYMTRSIVRRHSIRLVLLKKSLVNNGIHRTFQKLCVINHLSVIGFVKFCSFHARWFATSYVPIHQPSFHNISRITLIIVNSIPIKWKTLQVFQASKNVQTNSLILIVQSFPITLLNFITISNVSFNI